jgi:antitoxin component of RelBE/YafQ-DinJ toxin-antitoxin module
MLKDKNIHLRITQTMKNEISLEAKKYGLSVSNYLIFLHCNSMRGLNK